MTSLWSPPSQRRWCSAVVLLWLVVSSSFPAPGCLRVLPTPCHGATCTSPMSMRSYTLTECVLLFLSRRTTCTVGPSSSPTCANCLGVGKVSYTARSRKDIRKSSIRHSSLHVIVLLGRFHLVRRLELRARWILLFFLKVLDSILDQGSLFLRGGL